MDPEKRLDHDYFNFISVSHDYYSKITDENVKQLADKWLVKILGQKVEGIRDKRNRNTFMMQLLTQMHSGDLTGVFAQPPEDGDLSSSKRVFDDMSDEEAKAESPEGAVFDDIKEYNNERTADARTYVCIRHLPECQGMYGFISLTLDKKKEKEYDINPCTVDKTKLRHAKALRRLHEGRVYACVEPSEREMEDFYLMNVEQRIAGDVSEMFEELAATSQPQCWNAKSTKSQDQFFKDLLKQIDQEIKGDVTEDHKLVKFLVSRLNEDLKKDPKMKHVTELPDQQRHLRTLEILRQKLVVRRQEKKHRKMLAELEESFNKDFGCTCKEDEQLNFMWKLAVNKPLKDSDMRKLEKVYPPEVISVFTKLLARDRQEILQNGLQRQQDLLESIRTEIYRDIQRLKEKYNKTREEYREWTEILANVEQVMFEAGTQEPDNSDDPPDESEDLVRDLKAQIKEMEYLAEQEARRGEELTAKITEINSWTFSTDEKCKDWSWEIKQEINKLRSSISEYRTLIAGQTDRIQFLENRLASKQQSKKKETKSQR